MVKDAIIMHGGAMLGFVEPNEVEAPIYRTDVTVPVPVLIPIPAKEHIPVKIGAQDYVVSIAHTRKDPPQNRIVLQGNTWFENDRWGRVYNSVVKVVMVHHSPLTLEKKVQEYARSMFAEALKVVNRILEVSRVVIDKFLLYKIVDADVLEYSVCGFSKEGKPIKGTSQHQFLPGLVTYMSADKEFYHFEKSPEILERLASGEEIPLENGLIRNAYDFLLLENYRSAVIESQTAVEVTMKRIIRTGMIRNGRSNDEVNDLLDRTGFFNLVRDHLPRHTTSDFVASGRIYSDWEVNCYRIGNKVAHEGLYPSKELAEGAISAAKGALEFLIQHNL